MARRIFGCLHAVWGAIRLQCIGWGRRTLVQLALLLLIASLASACGGSSVTKAGDENPTTKRLGTTSSEISGQTYAVERKSVNGKQVFFIKERPPGNLPGTAMAGGEVVLDGKGCLRLQSSSEGLGYLLVWPANLEMSTKGGKIHLLDSKGQVKAEVGERIQVGGAGIDSGNAGLKNGEQLGRAFGVPEECRRGSYWVVGELPSTNGGG